MIEDPNTTVKLCLNFALLNYFVSAAAGACCGVQKQLGSCTTASEAARAELFNRTLAIKIYHDSVSAT